MPDPAVQKSFADLGARVVSQSADDGGYIHHHVIVNGRLFACYGPHQQRDSPRNGYSCCQAATQRLHGPSTAGTTIADMRN